MDVTLSIMAQSINFGVRRLPEAYMAHNASIQDPFKRSVMEFRTHLSRPVHAITGLVLGPYYACLPSTRGETRDYLEGKNSGTALRSTSIVVNSDNRGWSFVKQAEM